jgi:hypothetical protein
MSSPRSRVAGSAAALLATLALAGCGGDEKPRVKTPEPGPTCRTEGTVEAQPAASLEAAVEPYNTSGLSVRIAQRVSGTAIVQLKDGETVSTVITLVRTQEGWAVTSIARC